MDWNYINNYIPEVVEEVKKEYILKNKIIKDDIFRILEKYCIVLYYPIKEEAKNRGFHIQRYLEGKLQDFVYINTAQPMSEQIFAAAHELGHVWKVADKVWQKLGTEEQLTDEIEEKIVGRFAAELLMPWKEFKNTFYFHIDELNYNPHHIRREEIIRVMVMQMSDYMVPYEAVRRRMIETSIIPEEMGGRLCAEDNPIIESIVTTYLKDLNTALEEASEKKTVPGLRDLVSKAEKKEDVSEYLVSKVKSDFSIEDVETMDEIIVLSEEDA